MIKRPYGHAVRGGNEPFQAPQKKTRYSQVRPAPADLLTERLKRTARIERSPNDAGGENLIAIFPENSGAPDLRIDLKEFAFMGQIGQAVADAILAYGKGALNNGLPPMRGTISAFARNLRSGFASFVRSCANTISFDDITTPFVNSFIHWLNRNVDGEACLAVRTKTQYLGALRAAIDIWRGMPQWSTQVPSTLAIAKNPWPGGSRQYNPTPILSPTTLAALYNACFAEATKVMSMVSAGRLMIDEGKNKTPATPASRSSFSELSICLAATDKYYTGIVPGLSQITLDRPKLAGAVKYIHGYSTIVNYLYPSPRLLVPFVLLFAIHFAYNPDTAVGSKVTDFSERVVLGERRLIGVAYKGRARRRQRRSLPVTDDPDNPAKLLAFIIDWTSRIRPYAPKHLQDRLFLYVPLAGSSANSATSFFHNNGPSIASAWRHSLDAFCQDHDLNNFTFGQVRHTILDVAHDLFTGDIRAIQAVSNHRRPQTFYSHYTSDAARQRNFERMGQVMELRDRWRETNGTIDPRRNGSEGDAGCATPGWRCADPYDSPRPGQASGRLCTSYGECPGCPLSQIDRMSPLACARAIELDRRIGEAQARVNAVLWLQKWAPIQKRLREYWLPRFPSAVLEAAYNLTPPPMPPVE